MSGLARSVAKGSGLGLVWAGLSIPVALVSTPLFLRGLGTQGFGHWGLLQACFAGLNLLSFGANEATLYFVARDGAKEATHSRVLALAVAFGLLTGVLVLALGPLYGLGSLMRLPEAERAAFEAMLVPAAFLWGCQFFCFWLQVLPRARQEYGTLTLNQMGLTLAAPFFGWLGLWLGKGSASWFLIGQGLAWAGGGLALWRWNARHAAPIDLRPGYHREAMAEAGRYARWAFVFMLSAMLLNSSDRLLLGALGAQALAGFTAASSLTQRVYAVTGLISGALTPALARIKEGVEIERLERGVSVSLRALALFWGALLLPLAAWGDRFMGAWLKDPGLAAETYPALLLLCLGAFFGALASGCHAALLGSGRPRLAAVTGLAAAALGLAAAFYALPRIGVAGAALLGLVGNAAAFLLRLGIMEKGRFKRPLSPLALEIALGCAALAGLYLGLRFCAGLLDGRGLIPTVLAMLAAAALLAGLGLLGDAFFSKLRGRPALLATLRALGAA